LVQRTNLVAGHEEEGAEADRKDRHRRKVAAALLDAEIAKRKAGVGKVSVRPGMRNESQKEPGRFGAER